MIYNVINYLYFITLCSTCDELLQIMYIKANRIGSKNYLAAIRKTCYTAYNLKSLSLTEQIMLQDINISFQQINVTNLAETFTKPYFSASSVLMMMSDLDDVIINMAKLVVALVTVHCPLRLAYPNRLPHMSFPLIQVPVQNLNPPANIWCYIWQYGLW